MARLVTLTLSETIFDELRGVVAEINEDERLTDRPNDINMLVSEIINYALGVGKTGGMPDPMADEVYEKYINLKQGNGDIR